MKPIANGICSYESSFIYLIYKHSQLPFLIGFSFPDPNVECTVYYYAPVATQLGSFTPIWQPATLLANDTAGQAKWKSIEGSIPTNIPVKGTITGNFSAFTPTYSPTDPDCWWSYDKCVTPKLAGLSPDVSNVPEPLSLGYGFDDGPNCSHNAFYDYLSQENQKASKFRLSSPANHDVPGCSHDHSAFLHSYVLYRKQCYGLASGGPAWIGRWSRDLRPSVTQASFGAAVIGY